MSRNLSASEELVPSPEALDLNSLLYMPSV